METTPYVNFGYSLLRTSSEGKNYPELSNLITFLTQGGFSSQQREALKTLTWIGDAVADDNKDVSTERKINNFGIEISYPNMFTPENLTLMQDVQFILRQNMVYTEI